LSTVRSCGVYYYETGYSTSRKKISTIIYSKREKAEWRKAFKKEWKELSIRTINHNTYLTDIDNWICGCPAFLTNRFFICKHFVR